jgi:lipoate-protein ligase B
MVNACLSAKACRLESDTNQEIPTILRVESLRPDGLYSDAASITWKVEPGLVSYDSALETMENRVAAIIRGEASELIWLVEHPPLYTAGTSAKAADLVAPDRFPVFKTGRGGQYTYHGPGQRVAYVMLDLSRRGKDVRAFVAGLEAWIIATLMHFNVRGERRNDRVGVWVERPEKAAPVAGWCSGGQDRCHRDSCPPMGQLSRDQHQCRTRS